MAYLGLSDLRTHPELAASLGSMVVAWAAAERSLIAVFRQITKTDWPLAAAAYYRIPTYEARTKVLRAMITEWKTTEFDKEALTREIGKLNALARARNHWIHGFWGEGSRTGFATAEVVVFNLRAAPDTPERRKPVKTADVLNHIEAVHSRTNEIYRLLPDPLPEKSPQPSNDPTDPLPPSQGSETK